MIIIYRKNFVQHVIIE